MNKYKRERLCHADKVFPFMYLHVQLKIFILFYQPNINPILTQY